MKNIFKKTLLLLPVLFFAIVCIYNYKIEDKDYSKTNVIDSELDIINEEQVEFNNKGNIKKIIIKFDSNIAEFKNKINIKILDKDNKTIIDEDIDKKKIDYEKKISDHCTDPGGHDRPDRRLLSEKPQPGTGRKPGHCL